MLKLCVCVVYCLSSLSFIGEDGVWFVCVSVLFAVCGCVFFWGGREVLFFVCDVGVLRCVVIGVISSIACMRCRLCWGMRCYCLCLCVFLFAFVYLKGSVFRD